MGIEEGYRTRLSADAGVAALVSTRIYANTIPDGTAYPAIAYQLISEVPFDSNLSSDGSKRTARIQATLACADTTSRRALAEAVITALRVKGVSGDITILDTRLENVLDQAYDLETGSVARILDHIIYFE